MIAEGQRQTPRAGLRALRALATGSGALLRLLRPAPYVAAFRDIGRIMTRNRGLTAEMTRRDIRGEHAGQLFGAAWGIGQPLFVMVLYAFIFGVVFRVKIGGTFELPRNFTVYLLAGMIPWLAFVQSMARSSTAVTENVHLVKQTLFEVTLLPVTRALGAMLPLVVGLVFVTLLLLVTYRALPATFVLVPALVAIQFVAMAGIGFALSAVGAFVRDVKEFVQMFALMGIFFLPIVYLPDSVPAVFKPVVYANPFSYMVWCYQDAIYFGRIEHPWAWLAFAGGSLFVFVTGYRLFRKVRPYFGDVL